MRENSTQNFDSKPPDQREENKNRNDPEIILPVKQSQYSYQFSSSPGTLNRNSLKQVNQRHSSTPRHYHKRSFITSSTNSSLFIFLATFISLAIVIELAQACPTEIRTFCACVDEHDGVLLNCSMGVDVAALLDTMRAVQSKIGLLKMLSIRNSKVSVLTNNMFVGLYVKRLEMINCKIRSIEVGAFSGLETILIELNLSNNLLVQVPVKTLAGFNSLTKLDLSNNSIGELKADDALPALAKLMDIDLSRNKISNIHKTFFESAKNNLQTINLGHNTLAEVPASALRGFRQLMALHLHNNQIRNLSALSFMNLPVLSLLNLASNRINSVHKQAFLNAPNLRFLYMTDNQLAKIQPYQFVSFEQLEMIDLSNNKLVSLNNDSFSNLKSLKQLYLGENLIAQIDEYAFENSSVAVLILESNQLRDITKDMFKGASKLQQLSLKNNRIKNVDPNAFYNNHALVMIDLSHNELMDLAPATFLSQLNMLLVDLSYNKLTRTPYSAFNKRITTVLLQENPLVCTEKMHIIQQGVGVFVPNSEDAICGRPKLPEIPAKSVNSTSASSMKPETTHELGNNDEPFEEESAFKQIPVNNEAHPIEVEDDSARQSHHLPNIRPLTTKKISTSQINQFIDQSQFQASSNGNPNEFAIHNDDLSPSSESVSKRRPIISGFSHFLQHTLPQNPLPTATTKIAPFAAIEHIEAELTEEPAMGSSESSRTTNEYDIANDPNQIYPLPVPFLKTPPKMHTARVQTQNRNNNSYGFNGNNIVITQTLPPSILIGPDRPFSYPFAPASSSEVGRNRENEDEKIDDAAKFQSDQNQYPKIEQFELNNNNLVHDSSSAAAFETAASSGKFATFEPAFIMDGGGEHHETPARSSSAHSIPTAVIVVCLSTVALVMCAVFVGMCVAKRRQIRLLGSSADSSVGMSASPNGFYQSHSYHPSHVAAAARAAQMNAAIYGNGTLSRHDTLNRLPPLQDDIYGWMYSPTAYNAYANK